MLKRVCKADFICLLCIFSAFCSGVPVPYTGGPKVGQALDGLLRHLNARLKTPEYPKPDELMPRIGSRYFTDLDQSQLPKRRKLGYTAIGIPKTDGLKFDKGAYDHSGVTTKLDAIKPRPRTSAAFNFKQKKISKLNLPDHVKLQKFVRERNSFNPFRFAANGGSPEELTAKASTANRVPENVAREGFLPTRSFKFNGNIEVPKKEAVLTPKLGADVPEEITTKINSLHLKDTHFSPQKKNLIEIMSNLNAIQSFDPARIWKPDLKTLESLSPQSFAELETIIEGMKAQIELRASSAEKIEARIRGHQTLIDPSSQASPKSESNTRISTNTKGTRDSSSSVHDLDAKQSEPSTKEIGSAEEMKASDQLLDALKADRSIRQPHPEHHSTDDRVNKFIQFSDSEWDSLMDGVPSDLLPWINVYRSAGKGFNQRGAQYQLFWEGIEGKMKQT